MATGGSPVKDLVFYKTVIKKCRLKFIEDLNPVPLLDVFLQEEYLTVTQERDIRELATTSDKNREILNRISKKGVKGYKDFKICLIKSNQKDLVEILEATEVRLEEEASAAKDVSAVDNIRGFKCSVCDLSYDTVERLVQHTRTPEHLELVMEQQDFEKQNREKSEEDETGGFASLSSVNEQTPIGLGDQGDHCYLCNINFTSPSHADSHFSGKQHKKKKALFDMKRKQPLLGLTGSGNVQQSVENVVDHLDNTISLQLDTLSSSISNVSVGFSTKGLICEVCQVPLSSQLNAQQHYDGEKHNKKMQQMEKQKLGEVLPLSCDVCKCNFNGQESAEAHFNSEKHKKREKKTKSEGTENIPLYCNICACEISSEYNAKQHFEGRKHKKKLAQHESGNADTKEKSFRFDNGGQQEQFTDEEVSNPTQNGETVPSVEDDVALDLESLSLCDK